MVLFERFDLDPAGWSIDRLQSEVARTVQQTWERLGEDGQRHPRAPRPKGRLAPLYAQVLLAAMALETTERAEGWQYRHEQLQEHYLRRMPSLCVELLGAGTEPHSRLFHTPLDLSRMPALSTGRARMDAILEQAGVENPFPPLAGRTVAEIYSDLAFGGSMPMLYAYPPDITAYGRELAMTENTWEVIDRRLTVPLLHEHGHLSGAGLYPPYLDECISGYLGALAAPQTTFPPPGSDNGLRSAAWFTQVGQALHYRLGLDRLVRIHAGVESLDSSLEQDFVAFGWERYCARRELHFLGDTQGAQPWTERAYRGTGPSPLEAQVLGDALRAMCLQEDLGEGSARVSQSFPQLEIYIQTDPGSVRRGEQFYAIPPYTAQRLLARGITALRVSLERPDSVRAVVETLLTGAALLPGMEAMT